MLLAFVAPFCLYVLTLAPSVLEGDSGEFQTAVPILGVVHPTGYPLYLLLARVFQWVGVGDPAFRVNLFSAFASSLTCMLLFVILSKLGCQTFFALLGVAYFALSSGFWLVSVVAEVYSLHLFLFALFILILAEWLSGKASSRWGFFALSLGLAHHRLAIMWIPSVLCAAALHREKTWTREQWSVKTIVPFLPLFLYLYLPLRVPFTPYLTIRLDQAHQIDLFPRGVLGYLNWIIGAEFAASFAHGVSLKMLFHRYLALRLQNLGTGEIVVGAFLCSGGFLWLFRRWRPLLCFLLLAFMLGEGVCLAYPIHDIDAYFLSSDFVLTIIGALGIQEWLLISGVKKKAGQWAISILFGFLAVLLLAERSFDSYGKVKSIATTEVRDKWTSVVETTPKGAVIIGYSEHITPLLYFQHVLGRRRDITPLFPMENIIPNTKLTSIASAIAFAAESDRPLFTPYRYAELDENYDLKPAGAIYQVYLRAR